MNENFKINIESCLADYNKQEEEISSEIEKLSKSTKVLKDNIFTEFEKVDSMLFEDLKKLYYIYDNLTYDNVSSGYYTLSYFSIFEGTNVTTNVSVDYSSGNKISIFAHGERIDYIHGRDNLYYTFGATSKSEIAVRFYYSDVFEKCSVAILQKILKKKLDKLNADLKYNQEVLQKAQPLEAKDKNYWSDYIKYLLNWSATHVDASHVGESPMCWEDWLEFDKINVE